MSHPGPRVYGVIARNTEGGVTWSHGVEGPGEQLRAVAAADANTWFAVGSTGATAKIFRSTNFGQTWTTSYTGTGRLYAISFGDAQTGTAVGWAPDHGAIVRTIDGGDTWTEQESGTTALLNSVSFVDANTGTAVGSDGIILRTTTGGE